MNDAGIRFPRRMRGVTLAELLVAITLGAIILGGAVTLFVNNRDTYKTTTELSRLQETARYALDMMVRDIRSAGNFGCHHRLDTVVSNVTGAVPTGQLWEINVDGGAGAIVTPIEGMDDTNTGAGYLPSGFAVAVGNNGAGGQVLAGSDAITLRYVSGNMNDVGDGAGGGANGVLDYLVRADASQQLSSPITIDDTTGLRPTQIAGISDCGGATIFQIDAVTTTQVTANDLNNRGYKQADTEVAALVAPYVGVRYYVGDTGRGPGGVVYPALFRQVIADTDPVTVANEELFEGIERMQILYGVDTLPAGARDGMPDVFVPAGTAPLDAGNPQNWRNVVSVRIGLLVRTVDEHGRETDPRAYNVNNSNFGPVNDRRRRRVFTTTVLVRNQQPAQLLCPPPPAAPPAGCI